MEAFSLNSRLKSQYLLIVCYEEACFHNLRFKNLCGNLCGDLFLIHSLAVKSKLTCNAEKVLFTIGHEEIFYCRISSAACGCLICFCSSGCCLYCRYCCSNVFRCFGCFRLSFNCCSASQLWCLCPVRIILTLYFFYNRRSFCCSLVFLLNINSVFRSFLIRTILTEGKPFLGIHKLCSLCLACI